MRSSAICCAPCQCRRRERRRIRTGCQLSADRKQMRKACVIAALLFAALGGGLLLLSGRNCFCMNSDELVDIVVRTALPRALERFRTDMGRYPTSDEGLTVLWQRPSVPSITWKGPYLENTRGSLLKDPWGIPFQYCAPGLHNPSTYDVWSFGPDKNPSDDDRGNWGRACDPTQFATTICLVVSGALAVIAAVWNRLAGLVRRTASPR